MAHVDIDLNNVQEQFSFTGKLKKNVMIVGVVGLVLLVVGLITAMFGGGHDESHAAVQAAQDMASVAEGGAHAEEGGHHGGFDLMGRIYANIWLSGVYFTGIALLGFFFFAVQFVTNSGWSVLVQRVMLNFRRFIPIGGVILFITFILDTFVGHGVLFHWTHHDLVDPASPTYDPIIAGKQGFLNIPFFLTRMVIFVGVWTLFGWMLNKITTSEDQAKGSTTHFRKAQRISIGFLIFFGVSESITSWDWVMSIDPHWFSTLFGWYNLSSWLVTALAVIILVTILLKEEGYLKLVNENHLHDLGKFLFGFSIFWAYLWVAQFLLIYYANIPEETVYYIDRLKSAQYYPFFVVNLILNFFLPFFILMTRDAKRKATILKIAAIIVIIGHFIDYYLMIMPGVAKAAGAFGMIEIGMGMIFFSGLLYMIFAGLTKNGLIPENHPMLEESIHHHT